MSEWKLKRGDHEYPIRDTAMLVEWAQGGRILHNDYVLNPTLNRWMLAAEVPELAGQVGSPPTARPGRPAARGACGLAVALFLFAIMLGMFGMGSGIAMMLTSGAFIFAIFAGILYVLEK